MRIFQRAIDDISRENIGTVVQVYKDEDIIYSETVADYLSHLEWVLRIIKEANSRVSIEKSAFFKSYIEFLGFIVSRDGIVVCEPRKVSRTLIAEQTTVHY